MAIHNIIDALRYYYMKTTGNWNIDYVDWGQVRQDMRNDPAVSELGGVFYFP